MNRQNRRICTIFVHIAPIGGKTESTRASKMTELLSAAQMRAIEQAAIASGEVTGLELMERAGSGVVAALLAEWPELAEGRGAATGVLPRTPAFLRTETEARRALVLCGPGNNGGDGFVVARLLRERGWEVAVFLYGDAAKLPPDARVNYDLWRVMGEIAQWEAAAIIGQAGAKVPDVIVDAVFGTGLTRPLPPEVAAVMTGLPAGRLVAVDAPSGLCMDSGRVLGEAAASAALTVTFHARKLGHVLSEGPLHCGALRLVDIGLGRTAGEDVTLAGANAQLGKGSGQHKFDHGHALILSGGQGRGGAARLSARAALRVGAGLVTLGCPPDAMAENAARLDAIMLRQVGGAGLAPVLADRRINALCLGPGFGLGALQARHVAEALGSRRALVLDADALTLLARDAGLLAMLHADCVLTPHAGEFARLFPDIAARLAEPATRGPAFSRVDAARAAAARAGCVLLFKGADTVIAAPSGACRINAAVYDRAAPWLATAGAGDVLAGIITGLLARGLGAFDAAATGAWLHVEAARSFGPGLIAEDLPGELPKVFRGMRL
jgi:hydroxyethylthiazole kinase-like uncharacterized protein yjeF